jgi:undecaprenyl-diphosphatase
VLRFDRVAAARLSFLMSLPIIFGAGVFKYIDVGGLGGVPSDMRAAFAVGMVAAAITGFAAVWGLLRVVTWVSFDGFAVYRVVAAIGVFAVLIAR